MNLFMLLLLPLILASLVHLKPIADEFNGPTNCLKCNNIDKDKINVHLVPHSHDDVGWLKTVDQYYYGLNNTIQKACVKCIITSVVEALSGHPDRRYIQVETAFFWKWWKDQTESMRKKFKELVDNGQIEMVNGAWSMNDEACTNYQSTIDQFTWGLRLLRETLGSCGTPKVGWQIDPFGHSREQASIFAQLGYDGVLFSRIHHEDKSNRESTKSLDFAWQSSANIPNLTIFGGIFATKLYGAPDGFCFDNNFSNDTIDDDRNSKNYNLDEKVKIFTDLMKTYRTYFQTNNILIPMGGDFQYANAESNFKNMDKLIKAFKNNNELNVFYSTPSCYIKAVHEATPKLSLKTDDFFPYSEVVGTYWTGYFSSRPTVKRFERVGHNILQATKQLVALNELKLGQSYKNNLTELREVMGTFQHHDAITGTERQHVASDYVSQLNKAISEAEKPIGEIIRNLSPDLNVTLDLASCLLSNISICTSQNADKFVVVVYNPLSWSVTHYVRLPIENIEVSVRGPDGIEKCDIMPAIHDFEYVKLPQKPSSNEVVFAAKQIPAFGYKIYFVQKSTDDTDKCRPATCVNSTTFGTEKANFMVDQTTNLLHSVTLNGKTVNITQEFLYYYSGIEGAYVFQPLINYPVAVATKAERINSYSGDVVDEFHQKWVEEHVDLKQIIRIYKDEGYIEFDWIVGNIKPKIFGRNVVTKLRIKEDFDNGNVSFTDSNGREMIKRFSYQNNSEQSIAASYYPVTSRIVIRDLKRNLEVALLNDRSQGGTSLNKGEIELMVHRRIMTDDRKGLSEPLNEEEFGTGLFVRGSHYLVLGNAVESAPVDSAIVSTSAKERKLAQEKLLQPWIGVASTDLTYEELEKTIKVPFKPLDEIPSGINILTFEPWDESTYLLRLEHWLEKEDDKKLSEAKQINLQRLFKEFTITDLVETTLGGNQPLSDFSIKEKYNWTTVGNPMDVAKFEDDHSKYMISLGPMQIRTFIVKFKQGSISFGNTI